MFKKAYEGIKPIRPDMKTIFVSCYAMHLKQDKGVYNGPEFLQKPVLIEDPLNKSGLCWINSNMSL